MLKRGTRKKISAIWKLTTNMQIVSGLNIIELKLGRSLSTYFERLYGNGVQGPKI